MFEDLIIGDSWFWVFCVTSAMFLYQVFHMLYFFIRLARFKTDVNPNNKPVSVVIASRNELKNLEQFLPSVLDQDYPDFQVVVVNDRSWDQTQRYLEQMEKKYERLHVITVHDNDLYQHGKKMAITLGIKGAKYDTLLLTDADCKPVSKNWIRSMSNSIGEHEVVLGYSRYQKTKGLLNRLIRFDTVQIANQYLSYALAGLPYMGVGRNLMYSKALFDRHKGFKKHYHIASGDDDLFINAAANKNNTDICIHPESITESVPKKTFLEWWRQKKRHYTTGAHYKLKHKILLVTYPLSFLLFIAGVVVSLLGPWIWLVLGMYLLRITIQLLIFQNTYKKLTARDLLVLTPILELMLVFINPLIHISNVFVKPKRWA